jgi:hypothetical protein
VEAGLLQGPVITEVVARRTNRHVLSIADVLATKSIDENVSSVPNSINRSIVKEQEYPTHFPFLCFLDKFLSYLGISLSLDNTPYMKTINPTMAGGKRRLV